MRREFELISIAVVLLMAGLLSVIAFLKGMRWEEIAAFIGGPAMLLLLIQAGNKSLEKNIFVPSASTQELAREATDQAANGLPWFGWLVIGLVAIAALSLLAFVLFAPQAVSGVANRWAVFRHFQTSKSGGPRAGHSSHAEQAISALYFSTAIQLGACTAAAEGRPTPHELTALKRVFGITDDNCPQADDIYQRQLADPVRISAIIEPYITAYGEKSALSETLIFGMSCIAMADSTMGPSELGLIRMTADRLGIKPQHATRILMSAGYFGAASNTGSSDRSTRSQGADQGQSNHQQNGYTYTDSDTAARARHTATLGLSTGADQTKIRKTWRKLASKYHPDKLISQNLPPEDIEQAETKMQAINEAYDWLKDHNA